MLRLSQDVISWTLVPKLSGIILSKITITPYINLERERERERERETERQRERQRQRKERGARKKVNTTAFMHKGEQRKTIKKERLYSFYMQTQKELGKGTKRREKPQKCH